MTKAPRFAEHTKVPVEKTRAEIEGLLKKHGASAFFSAYDDQRGSAMIGFRLADRMFRIEVRTPKPDDVPKDIVTGWSWRMTQGEKDAKRRAWVEQETRRRWRAQLLLIKAKLEMISTGETTAEREFLADMLTPNGQTVGQQIVLRLKEMYASGVSMPLLGSGGGEDA